jgi:hypothetical protein
MEYILLIVYFIQGQGWSATTAEFGDKDACESALTVAAGAFNAATQKFPTAGSTGKAFCLPKHSAKP